MQFSLWGYEQRGLEHLLNAAHQSYLEEIVNVEQNHGARRLSELTRILQEREEQIRSQRNVLRKIVEVQGGDTTTYEVVDKQSEIDLMQDVANRLRFEIAESGIERNQPPRVTVLSEAEPAIETNWNRRVFIALGVGIAPLLLTIVLFVSRQPSRQHGGSLSATDF